MQQPGDTPQYKELPEEGALNDDKPSSLITSYHYLRYILLGFFLYVSHKYIQLCYSADETSFFSWTPVRFWLMVLYALICLTILAADIRNYVLYKLLLFEFYQDKYRPRDDADKSQKAGDGTGTSDDRSRTLKYLTWMLEQRGIADRLKGKIEWLKREDKRLKDGADNPLNCVRKLAFNWMMFWAVQPGPVSCCIITLYIASFIILGVCGFWLGCWSRHGQTVLELLAW